MIEELVYYPALPAIPSGLLETTDAYNTDQVQAFSFDRYCSKDGVAIPNTVYSRYPANKKICAWFEENIASDYTDIGISLHGTLSGASTSLPHTDNTRDWLLIWLLDAGGTEVDTVFWQEKNQPVFRSKKLHPTSYDNLIEIGRARYKQGRWALMDTRVIHSVEGIMNTRKSLQIGFWDNSESIKRFKAMSMVK